tara:strand:- start:7776 stop:7898 length:123 start_codon:yes stop_codon:yes gene_type:complete
MSAKCFECRQIIGWSEKRIPDTRGRIYCSKKCLDKRREKK